MCSSCLHIPRLDKALIVCRKSLKLFHEITVLKTLASYSEVGKILDHPAH